MSIFVSDFSGQAPSVFPVHLNLLASDEKYAEIVLASEIDVNAKLNGDMLRYIDEAVEASGGFGVFHWMGVFSAGLNPFSSDGVDFVETDQDAVLVGFTEYGFLFLGTKAAHAFYWDSIVYVLDMGQSTVVLQVDSGYQVAVSDSNFYYMFNKMFEGLDSTVGLDAFNFGLKS